MKIAVFGGDRETVDRIIEKLEWNLSTAAVKPKLGTEHPIVEMAKETYGQNKRKNVVYDGCVLQFLSPDMKDEDLFDVYEQIVLTSLVNIDRVYFVYKGVDEKTFDFIKEYSEVIGDNKILFISQPEEIIL